MKVWYCYFFYDKENQKMLYHKPEMCTVLSWNDTSAIISRANGMIMTDGTQYLLDQSKLIHESDAVKAIESYLGGKENCAPYIKETK